MATSRRIKMLKYIIINKNTGNIEKSSGHDSKEDLRKHIVMAQFAENCENSTKGYINYE